MTENDFLKTAVGITVLTVMWFLVMVIAGAIGPVENTIFLLLSAGTIFGWLAYLVKISHN